MAWTNRQIGNYMLKVIRDFKFTHKKVQRGNGYFILDMGDDSVVHFEIKECPGWLFAFWINSDAEKDEDCITIFTRHKSDLDKFKPSRSFFKISYSKQNMMDSFNPNFYMFHELEEILTHIKKNPIVAYVQSYYMDAYTGNKYVCDYVQIKLAIMKYKCKDKYNDIVPILMHKYKLPILKRYDIVDDVEFIDNNRDGLTVSPRYDMVITFKTKYKDDVQEQKECEILNRYFHRPLHKYDNIHISCRREDGIPYTYD